MPKSNAERQKKSRDKKRDPDKRELRMWVLKENYKKYKAMIKKGDSNG